MSETLLSPTDYRTKAAFSEKEMFHILPKLQAKRADFLTVMLTGSLHQRRGFITTPPDTQNDGPRDDDVTKSESDSMEQSQEGPPSTLLADDPQKGSRDPGSVAEVDPDQEDISKTLVLFSPGDVRKSPTSGDMADQAIKELPFSEKSSVELKENNKTEKDLTKMLSHKDCGILTPQQHECNQPISTASAASPLQANVTKNQLDQEYCSNQSKHNDVGMAVLVKQKSKTSFTPVSPLPPTLPKEEKSQKQKRSSIIQNEVNGLTTRVKQECKQTVVTTSSVPLFTNMEKHKKEQEYSQRKNYAEDIGISRLVKQKSNPLSLVPVTNVSAASPPFTKVEQTFIQIAETTHLNIMCSRGLVGQEDNPDVFNSNINKTILLLEAENAPSEILHCIPTKEKHGFAMESSKMCQSCVKIDTKEMLFKADLHKRPKEESKKDMLCDTTLNKLNKPALPSHLRGKSRIPVLVPEDGACLEGSSSTHEQTWKRTKAQDLARLVLERQKNIRSTRLNSRTSSSLSSVDEPRRTSETPSTTASEEEMYQSDELFLKVKKEVRNQGSDGWHSRIPRPATPIRRPLVKLLGAGPTTLSLPKKHITKTEDKTQNASYGLKTLQSGTVTRSKSVATRSGSPRMPLRGVFSTSRSLSTMHRTDSPSPHRLIGRTSRNSQTRTTMPSGNQTKAALSTKHTANMKEKQNTTAYR